MVPQRFQWRGPGCGVGPQQKAPGHSVVVLGTGSQCNQLILWSRSAALRVPPTLHIQQLTVYGAVWGFMVVCCMYDTLWGYMVLYHCMVLMVLCGVHSQVIR